MQKLNLYYQQREYQVDPLITAREFVEQNKIKIFRPMAVVINGHLTRMNKKFSVDSKISLVPFNTFMGARIYESSVLFLLRVALQKMIPGVKVFIQHSIHCGIYVEIQDRDISPEEIKKVEQKMQQMVAAELPIEKKNRDWEVALGMMKDIGRNDIVNLHRYARPGSFKYYELDGVEDVCYLPLVENTKFLPLFKLLPYQDGMVIVMPRCHHAPKGDHELELYLPEFVDQPQLFKTFHEYKDWSLILKVRTVGQLNRYIMDDEIGDVIRVAEALQEKKIVQIADQIAHQNPRPKFIFISGPSSSGKTTFAKRLGTQLMVNGMRPIAIELDNYFVERERTPRDENGDYDFESLEAIDVEFFNQQLNELLEGKEVCIPRFDFRTGSRRGYSRKLKLSDEHIIVVEGIHALNPKLTHHIDRRHKFLVYISALTQLNLHRHDRISTSDSRLIRRIVRDNFFRGYSASETIARWPSVRKGEDKNIFPLQENADAMFNSALFYELSVLKGHAERALLKVTRDDPGHVEAQRLLKFLSYFVPIDSRDVPNSSLLREFIGGSTFDYN